MQTNGIQSTGMLRTAEGIKATPQEAGIWKRAEGETKVQTLQGIIEQRKLLNEAYAAQKNKIEQEFTISPSNLLVRGCVALAKTISLWVQTAQLKRTLNKEFEAQTDNLVLEVSRKESLARHHTDTNYTVTKFAENVVERLKTEYKNAAKNIKPEETLQGTISNIINDIEDEDINT